MALVTLTSGRLHRLHVLMEDYIGYADYWKIIIIGYIDYGKIILVALITGRLYWLH